MSKRIDKLDDMRITNTSGAALVVPDLGDRVIEPGETVTVAAAIGWGLCRGGLSADMPPVPVAAANFHPADAESIETFRVAELDARRRELGWNTLQAKSDGTLVARCQNQHCARWLMNLTANHAVLKTSRDCEPGGTILPSNRPWALHADGVALKCLRCKRTFFFQYPSG